MTRRARSGSLLCASAAWALCACTSDINLGTDTSQLGGAGQAGLGGMMNDATGSAGAAAAGAAMGGTAGVSAGGSAQGGTAGAGGPGQSSQQDCDAGLPDCQDSPNHGPNDHDAAGFDADDPDPGDDGG